MTIRSAAVELDELVHGGPHIGAAIFEHPQQVLEQHHLTRDRQGVAAVGGRLGELLKHGVLRHLRADHVATPRLPDVDGSQAFGIGGGGDGAGELAHGGPFLEDGGPELGDGELLPSTFGHNYSSKKKKKKKKKFNFNGEWGKRRKRWKGYIKVRGERQPQGPKGLKPAGIFAAKPAAPSLAFAGHTISILRLSLFLFFIYLLVSAHLLFSFSNFLFFLFFFKIF